MQAIVREKLNKYHLSNLTCHTALKEILMDTVCYWKRSLFSSDFLTEDYCAYLCH